MHATEMLKNIYMYVSNIIIYIRFIYPLLDLHSASLELYDLVDMENISK